MQVIKIEPGKKPEYAEVGNNLPELQAAVDGYIETYTPYADCGFTVICNEEGRLNDMPFNCRIFNEQFFGTILLVGVDGEEFTDVPAIMPILKLTEPQLWRK